VPRGFGWEQPKVIPPLSEGEVQVWRLDLSAPAPARPTEESLRLLDAAERKRAEQIRSEVGRQEFVAARRLLRRLLAAATSDDPRRVAFTFGAAGKPRMDPACGVEFNVSHSRGLVVVAISRVGTVGVDVEYIDQSFAAGSELLDIARENYLREEILSGEQALSDSERLLWFYGAWTRKEAVAKADGRGIASDLTFSGFSADQWGRHRITLAGDGPGGDVDYFVRALPLGTQYAAALATLRPSYSLALYEVAGLDPQQAE
jgi:4'-phosphopantetheinyl transferase